MRLQLCFLILIICFSSCQKKKNKFVLQEKSEMANLMLEMYDDLEENQAKIKNNQPLGELPESYQKIYTATMSAEHMNHPNFEAYAKNLMDAEEALYKAPKEEQVQAYKNVVASCLACHTSIACTGPIPKIKKVNWKEVHIPLDSVQ